jgi:hypothetical protein
MKNLHVLSAIILLSQFTMAQTPCLPEGISFSSQAQIDNFQGNFPGCTEIEGNVTINGENIADLSGLAAITSIGGYLILQNNVNLKSLSGLANLTHVGGWCWIFNNDSLTSLTGLGSLVSIDGDLQIDGNNSLLSVSGLDNLASIGDGLFILQHPLLESLAALGKLTSVGMEGLMIHHNSALTDLAGLENINGGTITYLYIAYNIHLSVCHVESICDYIASPEAIVEIYINAPGCNSQEEVEEACDAQGIEESGQFALLIHPNPIQNGLFTLAVNKPFNGLHLICFNTFGQQVHHQEIAGPETVVSVSTWAPGIYLAVVHEDGRPVGQTRMVVR